MNKNIKVSVIIPVYNGEKYLDRCLKSVTEQTVKDIEILIIVGLCKDSSLEKCIEWQKRDERIIVVSRKDEGLGDARNYGFRMSRGEYIAYVDCDDYIENTYIEKLLKPLLEDNEIELTCCGFDKVLEDKSVIFESLPELEGKFHCNYDTFRRYVKWGMVWIKMYRKNWLVAHEILQFNKCHEDDAHMLMIAASVHEIYFVQEILYHYFSDNKSSLMQNLKNRRDCPDALGYGITYLKNHGLYEKNKASIRKHVLWGLKNILEETDYDRELVEKVKQFLEKFYTEVMEDVRLKEHGSSGMKEKTVLFGAGADGRLFLEKHPEVKLAYIVDNDNHMQGTNIGGYQVSGFERLAADRDSVSVIIASSNYYYDMAKQLRENGIVDYMSLDEYKEKAGIRREKE